MNTLDTLDAQSLRSDVPDFRPGDTLKVHVRVVEGSRSRIQVFQGVVIRRQGGGIRETFTVRKVSFGVGVERTFPVHSPTIAKIEVATLGDVRRAKLYYLRERRGKRARIRELREPAPAAKAGNGAFSSDGVSVSEVPSALAGAVAGSWSFSGSRADPGAGCSSGWRGESTAIRS